MGGGGGANVLTAPSARAAGLTPGQVGRGTTRFVRGRRVGPGGRQTPARRQRQAATRQAARNNARRGVQGGGGRTLAAVGRLRGLPGNLRRAQARAGRRGR